MLQKKGEEGREGVHNEVTGTKKVYADLSCCFKPLLCRMFLRLRDFLTVLSFKWDAEAPTKKQVANTMLTKPKVGDCPQANGLNERTRLVTSMRSKSIFNRDHHSSKRAINNGDVSQWRHHIDSIIVNCLHHL